MPRPEAGAVGADEAREPVERRGAARQPLQPGDPHGVGGEGGGGVLLHREPHSEARESGTGDAPRHHHGPGEGRGREGRGREGRGRGGEERGEGKGAEAFYCTENHTARHESLALAMHLDTITAQVRGRREGRGGGGAGRGEGGGGVLLHREPHSEARESGTGDAPRHDHGPGEGRGREGRGREGAGEGRGEGGGGVLLHREQHSEARESGTGDAPRHDHGPVEGQEGGEREGRGEGRGRGRGEGKGAEAFFCTDNHAARHESLALAMHLNTITAQVRGEGGEMEGRDWGGEGWEGRDRAGDTITAQVSTTFFTRWSYSCSMTVTIYLT